MSAHKKSENIVNCESVNLEKKKVNSIRNEEKSHNGGSSEFAIEKGGV